MPLSRADLTPFLKKLVAHTPLSPADREAVLALPFFVRALGSHADLFRDGQPGRHCYVLLDGYALRYKLLPTGSRQILNLLLRGDPIGLERALFARTGDEVEMATRGQVAVIAATDLNALLSKHPNIARALWSETVLDNGIQREWTANIGRRDAHGRLSHLICEFAVRQHDAGLGDRDRHDFPFTQTQIADCTGLTPVHVNRVLQSLRGDGLIGNEQRQMIIEDWAGLSRVAGFDDGYLRTAASSQPQPKASRPSPFMPA